MIPRTYAWGTAFSATTLALCGALAVSVVSCQSRPGTAYLPSLSNGKQWHYDLKVLTPSGVINGEAVARNDGTEVINGKQYTKQVQVSSGIPGLEATVLYYRLADDGLYSISGKHKDQPEQPAYLLPLSIGRSWTATTPEGRTTTKVESEETLELSDRKYEHCIKLSITGTFKSEPLTGYTYLAPGIGPVKVVMAVSGVTVEELLKPKG